MPYFKFSHRVLMMANLLNPEAAVFTPRQMKMMNKIKIVSTYDPSQIAHINVPSQTRCLSMADLQRYFPDAIDLYFPENVTYMVWGARFVSVSKYMSVNEMWFQLPTYSQCHDVLYVIGHTSLHFNCGSSFDNVS